jgi:hypothetical protein
MHISFATVSNLSYIHFLSHRQAMEREGALEKLPYIEEHLLNRVILANSLGKEILVGDLLKLHNLGSQATIHSRLKSLASQGYVEQQLDALDGRKKKLIPTKLALRYFDKLSMLIEKAVT